jgi:ankyrin repeat protein
MNMRACDISLHDAVKNGEQNQVELLLAKGAYIDAKNSDADTPLLWATKNGHKEMTELLLLYDADVDDRDANCDTLALGCEKWS